jgi:hypothetical protein
MRTRSSPPQTDNDNSQTPSVTGTVPQKQLNAIWTTQDEIFLLDFIADRKSEAGDGMKFKASFWNEASAKMQSLPKGSGGVKTANSC